MNCMPIATRQLAGIMVLIVWQSASVLAQDSLLGVGGFYLGPTDSIYKSLIVRDFLNASSNPTVHASHTYVTTYRFSSPELNSYSRSVAMQKRREKDEADPGSIFRRPWYYPKPKQPVVRDAP